MTSPIRFKDPKDWEKCKFLIDKKKKKKPHPRDKQETYPAWIMELNVALATHMKLHIRDRGQPQVVLQTLQAVTVIKSRNLSYSVRSKYYPRNSKVNPIVRKWEISRKNNTPESWAWSWKVKKKKITYNGNGSESSIPLPKLPWICTCGFIHWEQT